MTSLPEFKVIRIICLAALLTLGVVAWLPSQLSAVVLHQEADSAAADTTSEDLSTEERYEQALEKARDLAKTCRFVSLNFFDNSLANSYQWKEKWTAAATDLAAHKQVLEKASLDWFFECEQPSPELVRLAGAISIQVAEEGNQELAWKILEKAKPLHPDPDNVNLNLQVALTGIKTNHFEPGIDFLKRPDARQAIESLEHQVDKNMFILCEQLNRNWQQEKEFRQNEAQQDDLPRVKLQLTTGDVVVELFEDQAPQTVANFITLVESGFYNGTYCHPVIKGLSMQGGLVAPTRKEFLDYVIKNESRLPQRRSHFSGCLSMSGAADGKDSATSGFGISLLPNPDLDWNGQESDSISQTVFGRVISGLEHVTALPATMEIDPETQEQKILREVQAGLIEKATVIRKRDHDYTFEKIPRKK